MESESSYYTTSSSSSNTMVSSSRNGSNPSESDTAESSNGSFQEPAISSDNSPRYSMRNYITSARAKDTNDKEESVILDVAPKSLFCPSEKSTNVWNDGNIYGTKKSKDRAMDFSHTEPQEEAVKDITGSNDWLSVFSSGLTPFGPAEWPPCFIWIVTIVMFLVISGELLLSKESVGEFLELEPFNYMLGPSVQILIQTGARFPPCMRNSTDMPPMGRYVCINATTSSVIETLGSLSLFDPATDRTNTTNLILEPAVCSLEDICGFGGFANPGTPDQAYRFLTPLFAHSGLVQWFLNMVVLMPLGMKLERLMSGWRFGVQYLASGLFGNVFGASFAPPTTPTLGCSAALFGLMACLFIDLAYRWCTIDSPSRHLIKLITYTTLGLFVLGVLPGADSFSNVGGLLGGLLIGISMMPLGQNNSRKRLALLWTVRLLSLILLLVLLGILLTNFYGEKGPGKFCTYCRYISCLPISGFCSQSK